MKMKNNNIKSLPRTTL